MAVAGVEGKPLRLKDLLELDCDSCSAAGFRCYPRHLCVAAPLPARHETTTTTTAEAHSVFGRSRSLRHPMLSIRSLSRRLRGSFSWMRRDEEATPGVTTSSSCISDYSESSESPGSSSSTDRKSESDDFSSAGSSAESLHAVVTTATTDGQEHEEMERGSKEAGTGSGTGSEADDKEQLSPVAVMDFPFDDDEDDAVVEDAQGITSDDGAGSPCSPSSSDSLAQLRQRRNIQLKQKMRHFRTIGEIAAVDLGDRFAALDSSDGHGGVPEQYRCPDTDEAKAPSRPEGHRNAHIYPDEHDLVALLLTRTLSGVDVSERLLLDFFAEARRLGTTENCEAAARLAQDWVEGTGARWGLKEVLCGREDLVAEIDRGQRWSSHVGEEEEKRTIGVVVAGLVIDEMLRELVNDLLR
uniref:Uncharacterized protein n=1 Tax=Avena sativa TaxID=4498 RepID=A0ACD5U4M9_AVESA